MLHFGVVLYNSLVESSQLLKMCNKNSGFSIYFFDNSDNENIIQENRKYANENKKINYINKGKNVGLSKAYNDILNEVLYEDNEGYIMWLDDDTSFSEAFICEVFDAMKKKYDIIMPKVIGQDGIIYSPNEFGLLKNKLVLNSKKKREINFQRINAINSCLTVRLNIYERNFYDERLFLDQVDQLFFDKVRNKNIKYKILGAYIHQNFSQRNEIIGSSYLSRFIIRRQDILTYGKLSPVNNILFSRIKTIMLGLVFTLRTKNFSYLKEGFK